MSGAELERLRRFAGCFCADIEAGAARIGNTANTVFAGRNVIFVLGLCHVLEKLWAALSELTAGETGRLAAWTRPKSLIRDGCYFPVYVDGQSMNILIFIWPPISLFSFPSRLSQTAQQSDVKALFRGFGTSSSNYPDMKQPDQSGNSVSA